MQKLSLCLMVALFLALISPSDAQTPSLFMDARVPFANRADIENRENLRYRLVNLSTRSIENIEQVELNLFPDLSLTVDHAYTVPQPLIENGYTWVGSIPNSANGRVFLTFSPNALSAYILYGSQHFTVRPLDSETAIIEEVSAEQIEISQDDNPIPVGEATEVYSEQALPLTVDEPIILDLMVVYSELARLRRGGAEFMVNDIVTAVAIANDAFINSQLNVQYNLVHTMEVSLSHNYTSGQMLSFLSREDGVIDEVLTARDQYQADFVSFIHRPLDYICGRGYVLTELNTKRRDDVPFNLIDIDCVLSHTLAHELGHNLGLQHNIEDADSQVIFPFAYGYRDPSYFRTVMAYACAEATPCERIGYFSNQLILDPVHGRALGNAQADNRTVLTYTAQIAQYFRGCPDVSDYDVPSSNTTALIQAIYTASSDNCSETEPVITLNGGIYEFPTAHIVNPSGGSNALPNITTNITIDGEGATLILNQGTDQRLIVNNNVFSRLTLRNMTIEGGNPGEVAGGAVYSLGELVLENVHFLNNTAYLGGAVYIQGTIIVRDSSFIDNQASYLGGGLMGESSVMNIDNTIFRANHAPIGGGLYTEGTLTLTNSLFDDNSAGNSLGGQAGGLYAMGTTVIQHTTIQNNRANDTAGALIIAEEIPVIIEDSVFEGNISNTWNGALAANTSHLQIRRTRFSHNQASSAGAFYLGTGSLTLEDSQFINNSVTGYGGAIYLGVGADILRSVFYQNQAWAGAALYLPYSSQTVTIANSIFAENSAQTFGGAIYNSTGTILRHNSFYKNSAEADGEAFHTSEGILILFGNAIEGMGTRACYGSPISLGYNLASDDTCNLSAGGDVPNSLALFGAFNLSTYSLPLLAGSPALNLIPQDACTTLNDFHMGSRPQGYACDSGALEMGFPMLDANNDSLVSPTDGVLVLNRLGLSVESHRAADTTGDGLIDNADVRALLEALGSQ